MEKNGPYDLAQSRDKNWEIFNLYLNPEKQYHLDLMKKRTQGMIEAGLIEEVKELLERGFRGDEKPLQSIGYKETLSFLRGEIKSLQELEERIFISTRQLAKAQRTFFSKITPKDEFEPRDKEKIFQRLLDFVSQANFSFFV
jgi:tRNA dimethylallyltransferase